MIQKFFIFAALGALAEEVVGDDEEGHGFDDGDGAGEDAGVVAGPAAGEGGVFVRFVVTPL